MVDLNEEEFAKHLAGKISIAISDSGKTKERIAEMVDVSKAAVTKWCNTGKIATHNLSQLAKVTSKPIAWFFPSYDDVSAEEELMRLNLDELKKIEEFKLFLISQRRA